MSFRVVPTLVLDSPSMRLYRVSNLDTSVTSAAAGPISCFGFDRLCIQWASTGATAVSTAVFRLKVSLDPAGIYMTNHPHGVAFGGFAVADQVIDAIPMEYACFSIDTETAQAGTKIDLWLMLTKGVPRG